MVDLRIVDAPVLLQESITDDVKMPTGGLGNYTIRLGDLVWYVVAKEQLASKSYVDTSSKGVQDKLDIHVSAKDNPHEVTKTQVGLGNVDNTADVDKPVSNAVNSAIITATTDMATKAYVNQKDNLKADKATTLSGYGITDAYTKGETYGKPEIDGKNGDLATLTTDDKTNLVKAINEVNDNTKGVADLYNKNEEAVAGANGWAAQLIVDVSGKTQQEINNIALDPNLAPLGWTQKDFNDSVVDVRKFIKKDMSNVTTGLQAAVEEAYGRKLYIPIPLQVLDTIYIERALILEGNKNTNYNNGYSLDFSLLGAGKDALSIGQTTITAGLTLKDLYIQGSRNGGTGILLGKSLESYSADFKIENVTLNNFDQGAKFSFVWDGFLNNFRVQNCTNGINHSNQVNAVLYSQCRIASIDNFALQFTNAEGVQFDACDISNLKRLAGSPISVFQSTLTFNTPYFEYVDGPSLMSVGSVGEVIGSSVVINNPQKLGKNIIVGSQLDYVEINGQDKDKVHVVGATLTTNINAKVSQRETKKVKNIIYHWNPKQLPSFPAYGGVAPTVLDYRNYLQLTSASVASGWAITTSLVVGKTYTLRYCIRKTATTDTLGLRHPSTSLALVADDTSAEPTIRTISFVAASTNLSVTWGGAIELFGLEIIEGNLSEFEQDPFHQSDFDRVVSVDRFAQPTTTGNWKAGDTVNKAAVNANPVTQWVYHGTVWRATAWATMSLPTTSLPILTANDIGVTAYDTTVAAFKRWNGTAWV